VGASKIVFRVLELVGMGGDEVGSGKGWSDLGDEGGSESNVEWEERKKTGQITACQVCR
jgi:hypothetical protein